MSQRNGDAAAFPLKNELIGSGLTKREYFAAMAMQGLCANSIAWQQHMPLNLAHEAVEYADAVLAELDKP